MKNKQNNGYTPRLREAYYQRIIPTLMERFQYKNKLQVPRLEKITLNIGLGAAIQNPKLLDAALKELSIISGQKPIVTKAKKSISNFKLRKGNSIGCMVTLRGYRMYEFLDRLITVAIPRIRDFRGISDKSFDGWGNYNMGVKEQIIFPEIHYDDIEQIHGLNIAIITTAKEDKEAFELLKEFGMPFRR